MFKYIDRGEELVADPNGDLTYDEAVSAVVEGAVAALEQVLWDMVDELEYLVLCSDDEDAPDNEDEDDDDEATEDGQNNTV
jgi:hypothetical protein